MGHAHTARLGVFRRSVWELGLALIVAGLVTLLFVAFQLFGTTLFEQHSQSSLARQFARAVAASGDAGGMASRAAGGGAAGGGNDNPVVGSPGAAKTLYPVPVGIAVDHLVIPAIGVDKYVVEGTDDAELSMGPGHYPGTPFPGQPGNAAIAGHRTTFGAPFFDLNKLRRGERIYVTNTHAMTFVYSVVKQEVVPPDDSAVLANTSRPELTLTTCNPRFSDTSRLIVVADLIGKADGLPPAVAAPAGSGRAGASGSSRAGAGGSGGAAAASPAAGTSDSLGGGNSNALVPALLFGGLALVVWIGTRVAISRTRKRRRVTVAVVGCALCLVPLWFCFESVVRVLPATL